MKQDRSVHGIYRWLFALGSALCLLSFSLCSHAEVLRIGYQKSSTLMIILKSQGTLEKQLAPLGIQVQWNEFSSGQPLLEALNAGSIDLSADVAGPVPLFAQAARAQLTYLAQETPSPTAQAIVVPKNSTIKTLAELKGKTIGVAKASGAHYLLLQTLKQAGLQIKDVRIAYLQPADARGAFEQGAINAWAIWDPFLSAVLKQSEARILSDGDTAGVSYRRFYLVSTPYARRNPRVLQTVLAALGKTGDWVKKYPQQAAVLYAPLIGLDTASVSSANRRRSYKVILLDQAALNEQQTIADVFYNEKLLPQKVDVRRCDIWKGQH